MQILTHWENHNHSKLLDSLHTFLFAIFIVYIFFVNNVCTVNVIHSPDCIVVYNLDYYIYAVSLSICLVFFSLIIFFFC